MQRLIAVLLLLSATAFSQPTPATTGIVATPEVELAYETYGSVG